MLCLVLRLVVWLFWKVWLGFGFDKSWGVGGICGGVEVWLV